MLEFLVFHNGIRDTHETVYLASEEIHVFCTWLYHTILDTIEVALDGGDGGLYLVREIGEEIRADFFLM